MTKAVTDIGIAELLTEKNITQYRLAVKSGIPHATLIDIVK